jgi:phage head maturation protease
MHESDDPRCFVGDVEATEVAEGLKVRGKLDLDTEFGASAYRQVKSRRVGALSIGCEVIVATKSSDGTNELRELSVVEVNLVSRPANPAALVTNVKAQGKPTAPIRDQVARDAFARYEKEGPAAAPRRRPRRRRCRRTRRDSTCVSRGIASQTLAGTIGQPMM